MSTAADNQMVNCLRCNKDIGSALGLCPDCRRLSPVTSEVSETGGASPDTLAYRALNLPTIVAYAASIAILLVGMGIYLTSDAFYYLAKGTPARVGGEQSYVELTLGRPFAFSGVVFSVAEMPVELEHMGMAGSLLLMDKKDYDEFGRRFLNSKACPASFLNSRLTPVTLIADEQRGGVKGLARGSAVSIEGFHVRIDQARLNGMPLTIGGRSDALIFVRNLSQNQ